MPRKSSKDIDLIETQVIEAFQKTSAEDREYIAQSWCMDYRVDLSDFARRVGLPPIALKIASLISTDNPLLVSAGRGVMWSALGCWVVIAAVELTGVKIGTEECQLVIAKVAFPVSDRLDATGEFAALKKLSTTPVEN